MKTLILVLLLGASAISISGCTMRCNSPTVVEHSTDIATDEFHNESAESK